MTRTDHRAHRASRQKRTGACAMGAAVLLSTIVGCASTSVPPELVHARVVLEQAGTGAASEGAAVEVEAARRAVARADASYVAHPGGRATLGLSFVAEHMALSAFSKARRQRPPPDDEEAAPPNECPLP